MEAPGTAPGSEWFITTAIYRHSRINPAVLNIVRIWVKKKHSSDKKSCFSRNDVPKRMNWSVNGLNSMRDSNRRRRMWCKE